MSEDRNTIAQELSVEQLDQFIRELAALPGKDRTLKAIQEKADRLGITISLMSAKSFRDTTFAKYLKRVERRRAFAEQVSTMPVAGSSYADAAAENLAELIFDMTEELADAADEGAPLDLKKAGATAFVISKIQQGTAARGNLQLKINEYERKERERAEKKAELAKTLDKEQKRGGITAETRALIDQELGALG